jgi:hypothetical protein
MHRLVAVLLVFLMFGLPLTALAQEPADGVINGQVVNGTEGGGSVAGIEITLITYVDEVVEETRTTETDEEGAFRFDNVATEHEYLVSANYMEVDYYYPVIFEPGETVAFVEVGVCDATTSDEAIRVGMSHIIVGVEEEGIQVTEVFWLVNDGDRTYVGTEGAEGVLVFTLPEGALSFGAPPELMLDYQFITDNKVTYLVPFPPGERQLLFSYMLAKPGSTEFTIPLEVDYPTDGLELMVEGENIEVATAQLAPAEPVIIGTGERFIHFRGENLPRGTVLDLRFYDVAGGIDLPLVIIGVVIAVIVIGIAVYLLKRRKRPVINE